MNNQSNTKNSIIDNTPQKSKFNLWATGGWALFTMFVWEIIEEGIENLIAVAVSSALAVFITKALSTLAIITATQGIKVCLKRFFLPFIKKITYKDGNDKVKKIKQFFTWIFANKKTLTGIASSAVMTLSGAGVINVEALPALVIGSLNITPIIYYVLLAGLALIGVTGKGFEKIKQFFDRKACEKAEKEDRAIVKQAMKENALDEKKASQTQAEQEKAKAKELAEKEKQDAKARAEAEYRAKVEQAKANLKATAQQK